MLNMSILDSSTPPLKPAELFVLAALHAAPLHGYGLVQEVATRSQGRIRIRPGNLYRDAGFNRRENFERLDRESGAHFHADAPELMRRIEQHLHRERHAAPHLHTAVPLHVERVPGCERH